MSHELSRITGNASKHYLGGVALGERRAQSSIQLKNRADGAGLTALPSMNRRHTDSEHPGKGFLPESETPTDSYELGS